MSSFHNAGTYLLQVIVRRVEWPPIALQDIPRLSKLIEKAFVIVFWPINFCIIDTRCNYVRTNFSVSFNAKFLLFETPIWWANRWRNASWGINSILDSLLQYPRTLELTIIKNIYLNAFTWKNQNSRRDFANANTGSENCQEESANRRILQMITKPSWCCPSHRSVLLSKYEDFEVGRCSACLTSIYHVSAALRNQCGDRNVFIYPLRPCPVCITLEPAFFKSSYEELSRRPSHKMITRLL